MLAGSCDGGQPMAREGPEDFVYEPAYLEYLPFDAAEVEANGHCLTTLAFNAPEDLRDPCYRMFDGISIAPDSFIQGVCEALHLRRRRKLIHFASEHDRHWFFVSGGTKRVFMVDLGEPSWVARPTGHESFESFIEDIREQYGLSRWRRPDPSIELA